MAFRPYTLWIDLEANRLTQGVGSESTPKPLQFIQGDTAQIEVHILKRIDGTLQETPFPAGSTLKVGIGTRELNPVSGTFTLGYDIDVTTDLPYNATATQIATALNALASVTNEGGVTVTQAGDGFIVNWVSGLSHGPITANADGLFPKSFIRITPLVSLTEQSVFLHLTQSVIAFSDNWQLLPTAVSNVEDVIPWDLGSKVTRLSISNEPSGGYVNLVITNGPPGFLSLGTITVPVNTTAADLRTLLRTKLTGANDVIDVVKTDDFVWDITLGRNVLIGIISESLISSKGLFGSLAFNTAEVHTFLAGDESKQSILEVNVLTTAGEQTVLQTPVTIFSDVIDSATLVPLVLEGPLGEQTANNRFVRRDLFQATGPTELNNIWLNLGVTKFGQDVADSISNSDMPSASNPLVTQSQLSDVVRTSGAAFTGDVTLLGRMGIGGGLAVNTANKLAIYNGNVVFSSGYGIAFGDGTTQTTAATTTDLTGYATESYVTTRGYITSSALSGLATESWVSGRGYLTINDYPIYCITNASHKQYRASATGTVTFSYLESYSQTYQNIDITVISPFSSVYDGWTVYFTPDLAFGTTDENSNLKYLRLGTASTYNTMQEVTNYYASSGALPAGWQVTFSSSGSPYNNSGDLNINLSVGNPTVTASSGANVMLSGSIFSELTADARAYGEINKVLATDNDGNAIWRPYLLTANYASLSGATFNGKVNFSPVNGQAGLNIGIGGTSANATAGGDLWIATGGANLNFRDGTGAWKVVASLQNGNVFTAVQTVDVTSTSPALRVTQKGTGNVLLVEDSTNPDASALVVDTNGNIGVGVATGYTSTSKLEVVGNTKSTTLSTGSGPTFSVNSTSAHSGGTDTLDLIVTINGANYRIGLRPA